MVLVVCGDFVPEDLMKEIKKRLIQNKSNGEIKRIYPQEPENIVKDKIEQKMDVSMPLYTIGIKVKPPEEKERVKTHITIEILCDLIIGISSNLYKHLYEENIIYSKPTYEFDFSKDYAHILLTGQSKRPEKLFEEWKKEVEKFKENGINEEDFERIKKKIYGGYIRDFNEVGDIARMFLSDYFKGINSFDYLEEIEGINVDYANQVLNDIFKLENMVISIVRNKELEQNN